MKLNETHIFQKWETFKDFCSKRVKGITTGIKSLDKGLLGLRGIVCILGEPASCKSTLALQISLYHAKRHGPVLFIDKENGINRLRIRSICNLGKVSEIDVITNSFDGIDRIVGGISKLPFYVCTENVSILEIDSLVLEAINLHKKPVLLVIDSLQALPIDFNDQRGSIDSWLIGLDGLKLKYENWLTILLTSEKRRGSYDKAMKDSGKESGRIEYKAELMLDLIYDKNANCIKVECTKNRDGPCGELTRLTLELADENNPMSFCYNLKDLEEIEI